MQHAWAASDQPMLQISERVSVYVYGTRGMTLLSWLLAKSDFEQRGCAAWLHACSATAAAFSSAPTALAVCSSFLPQKQHGTACASMVCSRRLTQSWCCAACYLPRPPVGYPPAQTPGGQELPAPSPAAGGAVYGGEAYYVQPTPGMGATPGTVQTPGMVTGYTPGITPNLAFTPGSDGSAGGQGGIPSTPGLGAGVRACGLVPPSQGSFALRAGPV